MNTAAEHGKYAASWTIMPAHFPSRILGPDYATDSSHGWRDRLRRRCGHGARPWKRPQPSACPMKGLAHLALGEHLRVDHPQRAEHLTRACQLFTQAGAEFDLVLRSPAPAPPPAADNG